MIKIGFFFLAVLLCAAGQHAYNKKNADWIKCSQDAKQLNIHSQQIKSDTDQQKLDAIQQDLVLIQKDIDALRTDCGLSVAAKRLAQLKAWSDCVNDVQTIVQQNQNISSDITHFNIVQLQTDVDVIQVYITQAKQDCSSSQKNLE